MKISSFESGKAGDARASAAQPSERILPKDRPRRKEMRSHLAAAQLTPLEQGILAAERSLEEIPDIRDDIVGPLRKAIEDGAYQISGQDIAEMMIRRRMADRIR